MQPIAKPPSASLNVYQPAPQSTSRSSQNVRAISLGGGRRKRWTFKRRDEPLPEREPEHEHGRAPGSHSRAVRIVRPSRRSPATGATV